MEGDGARAAGVGVRHAEHGTEEPLVTWDQERNMRLSAP